MDSTTADLAAIWLNPMGVAIIAMLLSGDIVHAALAQSSGVPFAPACFCFGWVAYSFKALWGVFGSDGRLLPPPDIPGLRVFNLSGGTVRTNQNWAVARIMSDLESRVAREAPMFRDGIRITVFEAVTTVDKSDRGGRHIRQQWRRLFLRRVHVISLSAIVAQIGLAIASAPWQGEGNWIILIVTLSGIIIGSCFNSLPQWAAEKIPERRHSMDCFALTRGRGFKDIIIVNNSGDGGGPGWLNLEKLAAAEPPRNQWRFPSRTKPVPATTASIKYGRGIVPTFWTDAYTLLGLPLQLWLTRMAALAHALLWMAILLMIFAVKNDQWYLLGIGALGLVANLTIVSVETLPDDEFLSLELVDSIMTLREMDAIMDFETKYRCGSALLSEFICRPMTEDEKAWWSGDERGKEAYDTQRNREHRTRNYPRSLQTPSKEAYRPAHLGVPAVRGPGLAPIRPLPAVNDIEVGLRKTLTMESENLYGEMDSAAL